MKRRKKAEPPGVAAAAAGRSGELRCFLLARSRCRRRVVADSGFDYGSLLRGDPAKSLPAGARTTSGLWRNGGERGERETKVREGRGRETEKSRAKVIKETNPHRRCRCCPPSLLLSRHEPTQSEDLNAAREKDALAGAYESEAPALARWKGSEERLVSEEKMENNEDDNDEASVTLHSLLCMWQKTSAAPSIALR